MEQSKDENSVSDNIENSRILFQENTIEQDDYYSRVVDVHDNEQLPMKNNAKSRQPPEVYKGLNKRKGDEIFGNEENSQYSQDKILFEKSAVASKNISQLSMLPKNQLKSKHGLQGLQNLSDLNQFISNTDGFYKFLSNAQSIANTNENQSQIAFSTIKRNKEAALQRDNHASIDNPYDQQVIIQRRKLKNPVTVNSKSSRHTKQSKIMPFDQSYLHQVNQGSPVHQKNTKLRRIDQINSSLDSSHRKYIQKGAVNNEESSDHQIFMISPMRKTTNNTQRLIFGSINFNNGTIHQDDYNQLNAIDSQIRFPHQIPLGTDNTYQSIDNIRNLERLYPRIEAVNDYSIDQQPFPTNSKAHFLSKKLNTIKFKKNIQQRSISNRQKSIESSHHKDFHSILSNIDHSQNLRRSDLMPNQQLQYQSLKTTKNKDKFALLNNEKPQFAAIHYQKQELPFVQQTLGDPQILTNLKKIAIDLYYLGFQDERVERALRYVKDDLRLETLLEKYLIPLINSQSEEVQWSHKFQEYGKAIQKTKFNKLYDKSDKNLCPLCYDSQKNNSGVRVLKNNIRNTNNSSSITQKGRRNQIITGAIMPQINQPEDDSTLIVTTNYIIRSNSKLAGMNISDRFFPKQQKLEVQSYFNKIYNESMIPIQFSRPYFERCNNANANIRVNLQSSENDESQSMMLYQDNSRLLNNATVSLTRPDQLLNGQTVFTLNGGAGAISGGSKQQISSKLQKHNQFEHFNGAQQSNVLSRLNKQSHQQQQQSKTLQDDKFFGKQRSPFPLNVSSNVKANQICDICLDRYENHSLDNNVYLWELLDDNEIQFQGFTFDNLPSYQQYQKEEILIKSEVKIEEEEEDIRESVFNKTKSPKVKLKHKLNYGEEEKEQPQNFNRTSKILKRLKDNMNNYNMKTISYVNFIEEQSCKIRTKLLKDKQLKKEYEKRALNNYCKICWIAMKDFNFNENMIILNCGDVYCIDCLSYYFQDKLKCNQLYKFQCPACYMEIDGEKLDALVSQNQIKKAQDQRANLHDHIFKNKLYCNNCSNCLDKTKLSQQNMVVCPFCEQLRCFNCNFEHVNEQESCIEVIERLYKSMKKGQLIQICPKCEQVCESFELCQQSHLYCQKCQSGFCIYCREINVDPNGDHWNPFSYNVCEVIKIPKSTENADEFTKLDDEVAYKMRILNQQQYERFISKLSEKGLSCRVKSLIILAFYLLLPLISILLMPLTITLKFYDEKLLNNQPYYKRTEIQTAKIKNRLYSNLILLMSILICGLCMILFPLTMVMLFLLPIIYAIIYCCRKHQK